MKKVVVFMAVVVAIVLVACGTSSSKKESSSEEETEQIEDGIKPSSTKVMGALKNIFEVEDKSYPIPRESFAVLNIQFKRLAGEFPLEQGEKLVSRVNTDLYGNVKGEGKFLLIRLVVEWLDADGNVIDTSMSDESDLMRLAEFDEGDIGAIGFFLPTRTKKTPVSFRITSKIEHKQGNGSSEVSDDLEDVKQAAEAIGAIGSAIDDVVDAAAALESAN